jgi:hypothetical protein
VLRALVSAHQGRILHASELRQLGSLLERATKPERRREVRHPMRSFWWLLPFAFALSAEWWLRRRAGAR